MKRLPTGLALVSSLLAVGLLWCADTSRTGMEPAHRAALEKIAAAFKEGKSDEARKQAQAVAKKLERLNDVMEALWPRADDGSGGVGVGPKAGEIEPDGIEMKLSALAEERLTPQQMEKEAKALEQMAYITQAICEVALARPPASDMGEKTKAKWIELTEGNLADLKELAAAARGMKAQDVQTAAKKINQNCNACHTIFRN